MMQKHQRLSKETFLIGKFRVRLLFPAQLSGMYLFVNCTTLLTNVLNSGGGSASVTPARISSPYAALEQRAYDDNTSLFWDFVNIGATSTVDDDTDACLVFINAWAQEGFDRLGIHDEFSDTLVNNIANRCANTIVVIHNAGIRLVDNFESNPNVKAIIFAHLPGQDSGRALVSLLYGDDNFSGKLPYTVAKDDSDYGHLLSPSQPEGLFSLYPQSNFTEGVYIDYRAFDKYNITPRYEFGFGLSYTTFSFSNLQISLSNSKNLKPYPSGRILQGGHEDLWEQIATVRADVRNTGLVEGKEVAQLYIGIPGGPVKQLRGFEKKNIVPGETVTVSFPLMRRDLSVWDVVAQKWKLQKGDYMVYVGSSSRQLPLVGILRI
jgi:beta-glucosidase